MILLRHLLLHYEHSAAINLLLTSRDLRAYIGKENHSFFLKPLNQVDALAKSNIHKVFM